MSNHILHMMSPARWDSVAAIVGDRAALEGLRDALAKALAQGAGGTYVYSSDGEGYALAIALESEMHSVYTAYAGEFKPKRSLREKTPIRAVANFQAAITEAIERRQQFQPWYRAAALLKSPELPQSGTIQST